jgi:DUF917 family protein
MAPCSRLHCVASQAVGKEGHALAAAEIVGGDRLEALNVAADMVLPVVDVDFVGRAFPERKVHCIVRLVLHKCTVSCQADLCPETKAFAKLICISCHSGQTRARPSICMPYC